MKNLISFNDVNLIGKDNDKVFSSYATKYFLSLIDDLCDCTNIRTINENGETIHRWELQNMEDKNLPF